MAQRRPAPTPSSSSSTSSREDPPPTTVPSSGVVVNDDEVRKAFSPSSSFFRRVSVPPRRRGAFAVAAACCVAAAVAATSASLLFVTTTASTPPASVRSSSSSSFAAAVKIAYSLDEIPSDVPLAHQLLLYDRVLSSALCGTESLIRSSLLESKEDSTIAIVLWTVEASKFREDHSEWLDAMAGLKQEGRAAAVSPEEEAVVYVIPMTADLGDAFRSTPLESLFGDVSQWPTSSENLPATLGKQGRINLADGYRLAIVHKYGGTYFDADALWMKSPHLLPGANGAGMESKFVVSNGLFRFEKGSRILDGIMEQFAKGYDGNSWGAQGPRLFSRMLLKKDESLRCKEGKKGRNGKDDDGRVRTCLGGASTLHLWDKRLVYPFHFTEAKSVASKSKAEFLRSTTKTDVDAISIHAWREASHETESETCREDVEEYLNTYLGDLRKRVCPVTLNRILVVGSNERGRRRCEF